MEKTSYLHKIESRDTPTAVGAYSQAIQVGEFIFCSGQIGLSPKTNNLVKGGIEKETKQALENLTSILKAGGASLKDVVKVDIFLTNIDDFGLVNEVYAGYFVFDSKPARQTVAVSALPKGAHVEMSCIAYARK